MVTVSYSRGTTAEAVKGPNSLPDYLELGAEGVTVWYPEARRVLLFDIRRKGGCYCLVSGGERVLLFGIRMRGERHCFVSGCDNLLASMRTFVCVKVPSKVLYNYIT
eukprot:4056200-Pyramimonas_sp.AAC.2